MTEFIALLTLLAVVLFAGCYFIARPVGSRALIWIVVALAIALLLVIAFRAAWVKSSTMEITCQQIADGFRNESNRRILGGLANDPHHCTARRINCDCDYGFFSRWLGLRFRHCSFD